MKQQEKDEKRRKISKGAASGATAIIFLIIGFQAAVFVLKVLERPSPDTAAEQIQVRESVQEPRAVQKPRTVYESVPRSTGNHKSGNYRSGGKSPARKSSRKVESFPFNPNNVTLEELVRLGLSERQAETILNYREKGGKFKSKADFKKMYTVSDSLYERLEPYIDIPKVELNSADSLALVSLKGIGGYYARKIIEYRDALGGFYHTEQLMEIKGIDSVRYEGFKEQIRIDTCKIVRFSLDTASAEHIAKHPYLGKSAAKAILRLREIEKINDSILVKESILSEDQMKKIKNYLVFEKK